MSGTLGKMAPAAIVLVLVAWCCWPYLEGPRPAAEVHQGGNRPRIPGSLLSPTVEPAPDRNPFRPLRAEKAAPPESKEPTPLPPDQQEAPAEEDGTDIFSRLVLDAVYIQGDRRVALINGQVCEQGEPLAISASTTLHCCRNLRGQGAAPAPGENRGVEVRGPDLQHRSGRGRGAAP